MGAAIGDAIGHPTEFVSTFAALWEKYPPAGVTGFELFWEQDGSRFAPYTDDTQMAEVVLRGLVRSVELGLGLPATMERIAEGFIEWSVNPQGGHRSPGGACLAGCTRLAEGVHWSTAGALSAGGCGSVMRAYPFGILFADDPAQAELWASRHSNLTHRAPIALAACSALSLGISAAMRGEDEQAILQALLDGALGKDEFTGSLIDGAIHEARIGIGPETTLSRLQGWAAHEAIAAAAYVFVRHPDDLEAGILEAANTPGDSDSIATLAGALIGAHLGFEAIPELWVRDVERTEELQALATRAAELSIVVG